MTARIKILELMTDLPGGFITLATLSKSLKISHRVITEAVRGLVSEGKLLEATNRFNTGQFILANRRVNPPPTPVWMRPTLSGYEARMRSFATNCEATRR
jgi:biotin operon repressor